jgi:kinesin family protein 11
VKKGVICQNLEEITVLSVKDIFEILQRGIQQRQTAATLCNKNSSRSHSIFTMKIMIKECNVEGEEVIRHGQLNLVDLAGYAAANHSPAPFYFCRRGLILKSI